MFGAKIEISLPYFACFRPPKTTSLVLTYPIPPFTTLIGMFANALGVHWIDYPSFSQKAEELLLMNICPIQLDKTQRELTKLLKLKGGEEKGAGRFTAFPSSPIYRYFLVRPSYRLYIASEDDGYLKEILSALRQPFRPLYLGQSDDMVVTSIIWEGEVESGMGNEVWGLLYGLYEGCEYIALPLAYSERETPHIFSLPPRFPFRIDFQTELFSFDGENVQLFNKNRIG